jgi:hypothetical protein
MLAFLNVKNEQNTLTFSRTRPERGEYISDAAFTDSEKDRRLVHEIMHLNIVVWVKILSVSLFFELLLSLNPNFIIIFRF